MAAWPINLSNLSNISILDWVKIILYPKTNLGLDDESAKEFQLYSLLSVIKYGFPRTKLGWRDLKAIQLSLLGR